MSFRLLSSLCMALIRPNRLEEDLFGWIWSGVACFILYVRIVGIWRRNVQREIASNYNADQWIDTLYLWAKGEKKQGKRKEKEKQEELTSQQGLEENNQILKILLLIMIPGRGEEGVVLYRRTTTLLDWLVDDDDDNRSVSLIIGTAVMMIPLLVVWKWLD